MPTRKQRRRREKSKRHEYEVVYVDDEGNEVEYEPEEREPRRERRGAARRAERRPARGSIQPPSWPRTAKRGLIFAPIMFATVLIVSPGGTSMVAQVVQTLVLLAMFVPFSYFLDSMLWRSQQRRLGKADGGRVNGKR